MIRTLGRRDIEAILPHRHPFLFVDQVVELTPGERIVGVLGVPENGRILFRDRSGRGFLPPMVLTEALAQVGAILVLYPEENRGRSILFRAIERARMRRAIPAGTTVRLEARVRRLRGRLGSLAVKAYVEGALAARGTMTFALQDG